VLEGDDHLLEFESGGAEVVLSGQHGLEFERDCTDVLEDILWGPAIWSISDAPVGCRASLVGFVGFCTSFALCSASR